VCPRDRSFRLVARVDPLRPRRPLASLPHSIFEHRPEVVPHQCQDSFTEFGRDETSPITDCASDMSLSASLLAAAATRTAGLSEIRLPLGTGTGRRKGSSLNSAFLTPKPLASSVYVHVPEAPSPHELSMSVMSLFTYPISVTSLLTYPLRSISSAHSCCAGRRRAR